MSKIPALYGQYDDEGNPLWMDGAVRQIFALRAENARLLDALNEALRQDPVMQEVLALRAENARLREALTKIAMQKTDAELDDDGEWGSDFDFVEGYDQCILTARGAFDQCEIRAELPTRTMTPLEKYGISER